IALPGPGCSARWRAHFRSPRRRGWRSSPTSAIRSMCATRRCVKSCAGRSSPAPRRRFSSVSLAAARIPDSGKNRRVCSACTHGIRLAVRAPRESASRMPKFIAARLPYAEPQALYSLAGRLVPWLAAAAALAGAAGLYVAFFVVPTDAQQGEVYRIVFVHVPAAWMSMLIYVVMAFWAAVGLSLNTRLAFMMAHALAPTGAMFTFLALWTGAIWGKPTWGAWWVWDARFASELILLFLYLGYMALNAAIDDPRRADRACALLALAGTLNLPLICYSVPNIAGRMPLEGVFIMGAAFWMYSLALALSRVRCVILEAEAA